MAEGKAMAGRAPIRPKEPKPITTPTEQQIRERAHEIYLRKGGIGGSDVDDWLQAEEELRQEAEE